MTNVDNVAIPSGHQERGYRCESCGAYFTEPGEPKWECSSCGTEAVQEERNCPNCNRFMAKVSDATCPACEATEDALAEQQVVVADDGIFGSEQEALEWEQGRQEREEQAARSRALIDQILEESRRKQERRRERRASSLRSLPERARQLAPQAFELLEMPILLEAETFSINTEEMLGVLAVVAGVAYQPVSLTRDDVADLHRSFLEHRHRARQQLLEEAGAILRELAPQSSRAFFYEDGQPHSMVLDGEGTGIDIDEFLALAAAVPER